MGRCGRAPFACSAASCAAVLACTLLACSILSVSSAAVKVEHRILVLTTDGASADLFMRPVLNGYGIPFDVVSVSQPVDLAGQLKKPDGTGRYSAIFVFPAVDVQTALAQPQAQALEEYQIAYGVRAARIGVSPTDYGYAVAACSSGEQPIYFTPDMPLGVSGIKPTAALNAKDVQRCPGVLDPLQLTGIMPINTANCIRWAGLSMPCSSVPAMMLRPAPDLGYTTPLMASAIVKYEDGREVFISTLQCNRWSTSCLAIGHLVVAWLLKNLIPGQRQALFTVHVDDIFLATFLQNDLVPRYRLGLQELRDHLAWQTNTIPPLLPPGSDFRLEFPFNGNGVLESYGDPASLSFTPLPCNNCSKDWKKPLGTGVSYIPANYSSSQWDLNRILSGNPVAAAVVNDASIQQGFFWSSHTFTHQNLDNATIQDSAAEFDLNTNMASVLGLSKTNRLSTRAVVTPQVSGLSNGDVLAALVGRGFLAAVGDNSWAHLRPTNRYHLLRTTTESSNYAGFAVIPRYSAEVYFDVATLTGQVAQYNAIYRSTLGRDLVWDEIVVREAERVVLNQLLALRADPHMLHQANMAMLDAGGSLLMKWVTAILNRLMQFVDWPVRSLKLDDLLDQFLAREARDGCGFVYTLTVDPKAKVVQSVGVTSTSGTGQCYAPLLLPLSTQFAGTGLYAGPTPSVGQQQIALQVAANGGSNQVTLSGAAW